MCVGLCVCVSVLMCVVGCVCCLLFEIVIFCVVGCITLRRVVVFFGVECGVGVWCMVVCWMLAVCFFGFLCFELILFALWLSCCCIFVLFFVGLMVGPGLSGKFVWSVCMLVFSVWVFLFVSCYFPLLLSIPGV